MEIDPTIFVVMGKWHRNSEWHIIGLFNSALKAEAACEDALVGELGRHETKIAGEFFVQ